MDTFDLRKFLAESKQPIQEMEAPMEVEAPAAEEAMEEIVAEYVQEALKGTDAKQVNEIIERTCNKAAMEMKMEVIHEVLEAYDGRINELEENAVFKEMLDETKMTNIKEIRKGLYEQASALKEEYKNTYMPETVEEKEAPKKEDKEEKSLKETLKPESNSVTMDMEDVLKGETHSTEVSGHMNKLEDYKKNMKVVPRFSIGNPGSAKENIGTVKGTQGGKVVIDAISRGKHVTREFGPEDLVIITGYATK